MIAEICLQAIKHNALAFQNLTGVPVCAVVKADAYGHGAVEIVDALQGVVDSFAVSILDEALAIRVVACGKEILILTPPSSKADIQQAVRNDFCITVDTLKTARLAVQTATEMQRPLKVHLKVNTGMNRYGMNAQTLGKTCAHLRRCPWIKTMGLYSHFYGSTLTQLEEQQRLFVSFRAVCLRYFSHIKCHISATYGALFAKRFAWDMVRVGLGLYGYLPQGVADVSSAVIQGLSLRPAMRVYAQVSATRTYKQGGAGYGTPVNKPKQGEKLYVLRAGYADGFLREEVRGVNRYCMDACIVKGKARVGAFETVMENADMQARRTGTIAYEVLCAMNRRAERIYTYGEFTFCKRRARGYKRPKKTPAGVYERGARGRR